MTNTDIEISIIVPCYNAEDFLPTLAECMQRQVFQNFEVILVNDGGCEKQVAVMDELAAGYSKLKIIHQPNGGVSRARNTGIKAASGKWIAFVDADDELKPCYLQTLHCAAIDINADIVIGGYDRVHFRNGKVNSMLIELNGEKRHSTEEVFELNKAYYDMPWNKLFKSSFIETNQFYFPLGYSFYEDEVFMNTIFANSKPVVAFVRDCGYIYNLRDESSASSKYHTSYAKYGMHALSLTKRIVSQLNWSYEKKKKFTDDIINQLGYDICSNYFRKGTPLSFGEKRKALRTEVLNNTDIIESHKSGIDENTLTKRLYHWCINRNSDFFMALIFNMLFAFKYRFYGLFKAILSIKSKLH
ncbi:MAG: glycosyltransferase [Cytophagaceae bacterium]|jgi:glycosyltransferase involved in cell wall biosynthesis|nr:glycosyltransferase [Cytophagaceae bacterium]